MNKIIVAFTGPPPPQEMSLILPWQGDYAIIRAKITYRRFQLAVMTRR